MTVELDDFLKVHPDLLAEQNRDDVRSFPLRLPTLPVGRDLAWARLELPKNFPERTSAAIRLPADTVLRVPHVGAEGVLCLAVGDPGPLSGASTEDRINQLIDSFHEEFLEPWCAGELDNDFVKEALNYWTIHCNRCASKYDAVRQLYTLNHRNSEPSIYEGTYLPKQHIVILGESVLTQRFVASMGKGHQLCRALVADVPISYALTPQTWPTTQDELERLLRARLGESRTRNFLLAQGRRDRSIHRIVVLRAPQCSFGFLLVGGPPAIVFRERSMRSYPTLKMLPLVVERLDPEWTCGRDQHEEVPVRQRQHVLVVGAGALGSAVIEHLTKSGIGRLTIVDGDNLSAANIGRHSLGADAIGQSKARMLARHLSLRWPSCMFSAASCPIQHWLKKNDLSNVDLVLDLTGEPDVRLSLEFARKAFPRPLLIGWMEPFVAAAHACLLPNASPWMIDSTDRLQSLSAVEWPDDVVQNEPACSSRFQSYTSAAAVHAVALVTEAALDLLDGKIERPTVRHWVRGQTFLDAHRSGLRLKSWANNAAPFDGVSMEAPYE